MSNDSFFKEEETTFIANPQETFETPFLNTPMYAPEQFSPEVRQDNGASWLEMETPFLKEFQTPEGSIPVESMEFNQFLNEMYDSTFNEALYEIAAEAFETFGDRLNAEYLDQETQNAENTRLLTEFFAPLEREFEIRLEQFKQDCGRYDLASISESELEAMMDRYQVPTGNLSPAFEEFLGKLWKKVKGVAKGAVKLAKKGIGGAISLAKKGVSAISKFALGPILDKLKKFIRPLLQQVLKFALNKLPANVRPLASRLAGKLLGKAGISTEVYEEEDETDIAATPNAETIQTEFDLALGELLFFTGEEEQETITGQYEEETEQTYENPAAAMQEARSKLVDGLNQMENGQDPTPLLEQFIPAALMAIKPVAKIVLKIIGRQKVVNFIAKFMATFIQKFIGQQNAAMLSKAIVDTGLKLLGLEIPPNTERNLASEAVASTLEQALTEIAAVPEYIFENETLLEVAVSEAMENAASAHFPPSMLRDEFHELPAGQGTWVLMPLRQKQKLYKKYTRLLDVTISPQLAPTIITFGGKTLADFLRDQLLIPQGKTIRAKAHLYEAIPGTWLSRISLSEKKTPGLGTAISDAYSRIHPLTPEAAAALFGSGKIGREVSDKFLANWNDKIAVGQRFYYLEIQGAQGAKKRSSGLYLVINIPKSEIRVTIFLSENVSQEVSAKLRQKSLTAAFKLVKRIFVPALKFIFSGRFTRNLKIITDEPQKEDFGGLAVKAIQKLLPILGKFILKELIKWISSQIIEYLKQRELEFINATTDPRDGVTLSITFNNVQMMDGIRKILRGELKDLKIPTSMPGAEVKIIPGFHNA